MNGLFFVIVELVVWALLLFSLGAVVYLVWDFVLCPLAHRLLHLIKLSQDRRDEIHQSMLDWYRRVRDEELSGKRAVGVRYYDEAELIEWERRYLGDEIPHHYNFLE